MNTDKNKTLQSVPICVPSTAVFLLGVLMSLVAAPALAAQPDTLFPRGTFDIQLTAAAAKDFTRGDSHFVTAAAGLGYYFVDNVSLTAELSGYGIRQDGSAHAAQAALMLRQHFYTSGPVTFFADVGSGLFEANRNVPDGGTHFNFTFRTGLGVTWRIAAHTDLVGGVHYMHLSNARIRGRQRNPSINAIEGYFGVMWTF
jgi:hypothetical protein